MELSFSSVIFITPGRLNPHLFICIFIHIFIYIFIYYFYILFSIVITFFFVLVQNWTLAWTNPDFGYILLFSQKEINFSAFR